MLDMKKWLIVQFSTDSQIVYIKRRFFRSDYGVYCQQTKFTKCTVHYQLLNELKKDPLSLGKKVQELKMVQVFIMVKDVYFYLG